MAGEDDNPRGGAGRNAGLLNLNLAPPTAPGSNEHPNQRAFDTIYKGDISGTENPFRMKRATEGTKKRLMFFEPDSDLTAKTFLRICLDILNGDDSDADQIAATYLSILRHYYTGLGDAIDKYFDNRGFRKTIIRLPSGAELIDQDPTESDIDYLGEILVLGQLTFLMYKNFTESNFTDYMSKRTKALYAKLSMTVGSVEIPFDLDIAVRIRRQVGGDVLVRSHVINHLLNEKDDFGPLGIMASYITSVIEWCEMGTFVFVNDVLVLTKSPVLGHPMVSSEVRNFYKAVCVVKAKQYPQFFRLMATGPEYHLLDRAQYPTLIDVAIAIKKESHPSLMRFVATEAAGRSKIILELKLLHTRTHITSVHPSVDNVISSLTGGE